MALLAPLFLVALAGLAIPVLLHLSQREKKQIVRFPSLMFVRRIPYQSVRRRRIRNWWLLALRLAALALIVLAFARPFFPRPTAAIGVGAGARELVVLLDTSYSMGYGDGWTRAREAAARAIASLGPSDRGSLVAFSTDARVLVQSAAERGRLSAALAALEPGAGATRYAPALKVAGGIFAGSQLPRREAILISDFQRGGWKGAEGARLPAGATLTPVVIEGTSSLPQVGVAGVSLARSEFAGRERITTTVTVINRGDQAVGPPISLAVGNIPVGTQPVRLAPGASSTVTFDPFTVTERNMRATVRLPDDALAGDNAFHFVASPSQPVRVTLVDGGRADDRLYLTRALAIGEAPRFEAVTRAPDAVSDEDLRRSAVVLINDAAVGDALARRLARFVDGGGGLLVAAGTRGRWPSGVDVLPASLGAPVDRTRTEARLGAIEFGHPVFEPFAAPRSGDFSAVRVFSYRAATPASGARVLARFDTGAPAIIERATGRGRVLLWTSSFDTDGSTLPIAPVFLPVVHQALQYLARYESPRPWMTVGEVLSPGIEAGIGTARAARAPSGARLALDQEGGDVLQLDEAGFYEVRTAGGTATPSVAVVASNVDPAEGDRTTMDPRDLVAAVRADGPSAPGTSASTSVPLGPDVQERSQRLWWYLLCAGAGLLAAETILSNRRQQA